MWLPIAVHYYNSAHARDAACRRRGNRRKRSQRPHLYAVVPARTGRLSESRCARLPAVRHACTNLRPLRARAPLWSRKPMAGYPVRSYEPPPGRRQSFRLLLPRLSPQSPVHRPRIPQGDIKILPASADKKRKKARHRKAVLFHSGKRRDNHGDMAFFSQRQGRPAWRPAAAAAHPQRLQRAVQGPFLVPQAAVVHERALPVYQPARMQKLRPDVRRPHGTDVG